MRPTGCGNTCWTGASQRADGRITFARAAVEAVIARSPSTVALPGFVEELGLEIGGGSTGGAAVAFIIGSSPPNPPSPYRLMRIVDRSQHIHYGVRPVVARDMKTPFDLDINIKPPASPSFRRPCGAGDRDVRHCAAQTAILHGDHRSCGLAPEVRHRRGRGDARGDRCRHAAADLHRRAGRRDQPGLACRLLPRALPRHSRA